MKWIAISGSRETNNQIEKDVQIIVRKILEKEYGVITGGALGVDYIATQTVIDYGNVKEQLKIYLPIKLNDYFKHYLLRADEMVITKKQTNALISQLKRVKSLSPKSIIDKIIYTKANVESYYARNTSIVKNCDILYAFQVNESKGTQDTINKARKLNKKVVVKKYTLK